MASDDAKPIDLVAMRRKVADTYEMAIGLATQHLASAEAFAVPPPDQERQLDMIADHLRFAEVYALLARACQKAPGSQF
jgi:hypothetical protein